MISGLYSGGAITGGRARPCEACVAVLAPTTAEAPMKSANLRRAWRRDARTPGRRGMAFWNPRFIDSPFRDGSAAGVEREEF